MIDPVSIREQIMQAVMRRVRALDAATIRGRVVTDVAGLRVAVVEDEAETVTAEGYGAEHLDLSVAVGAAVELAEGQEPGAAANALLAKLRILLTGGSDPTLGGLADGIRYRGAQTIYGDPQTKAVGVAAQFVIAYHTVRGNPYLIDLPVE